MAELPKVDENCWIPVEDIFLISKSSSVGCYHYDDPFPYNITKGKWYKVLRIDIWDMALGYWFEDDAGEYCVSIDWMTELRDYFDKSTDVCYLNQR